MARTLFPHDRGNLLLAGVPDEEREHLLDGTNIEAYERGEILLAEDDHVDEVYFPVSGMVSIVATFSDGSAVEVVTIGMEGVVGPPVVLGDRILSNVRAVVQAPGEMLRMDAKAFVSAARTTGVFGKLVDGYLQVLFSQTAQSVACNRLHELSERCSRWLLLTHDRVGESELPLTQEFLAEMLGVRRPTVTVAAGMLQDAGLISYRRGCVRIVDRDGLEQAACECYDVIRSEFERLYPFLQRAA